MSGLLKGIELILLFHVIAYALLTIGFKIGLVDDGVYYIYLAFPSLYQFIYVIPMIVWSAYRKNQFLYGIVTGAVLTIIMNFAWMKISLSTFF